MSTLFHALLDSLVVMTVLIALTRLQGLRSFSKLSGFDFAITVAMGSILASAVVSKETSWSAAAAALLSLFAVQWAAAFLRTRSEAVESALDNTPLLLMDGEEILEDNLRKAQMTRSDLIAKLREANVLDPAEVRAVVMETTGDVSVLHGPPDGTPLAGMLIDGVRRAH